ncbi:probable serine/threonine-protein kinase roco6 [Mercenaria mercenaria]|uniref:probable serine/threonine-protein kinase roco6 n=1 Tax=Mercenaria mercenaria TaxID=6596 RepID=UPI00234F75B4|nr:probable serine/threonine-protein kinase roco6 [Mercenaria mercenaria]
MASFHFANDPRARELYETAILQGKEKDKNVRVMVIGCYGQGKSSLVKCLTGQSIEDVESTNGIDICICNSQNGSKCWNKKEDNDISTESVKRLVSVAMDHSLDTYKSKISDKNSDIKCVKQKSNFENVMCDADVKIVQAEPEYSFKNVKLKESQGQNNEKKTTSKQVVHREKLDISTPSGSTRAEPTKASINRSKAPTPQSIEFAKEIKMAERRRDLSEKDRLHISIWDFGGQFVYYATHQLFHSRQAVYLLVFNIAQDLDRQVKDDECPVKQQRKTMKDYLKFWVDSVHTFAGNDQATEPPIFLVGTHLDQLQNEDDVDERFDEVRKIFEGSKSAYHIQKIHFPVSNTKPSETTLDFIRSAVTEVAGEQTTERFIPARWIPLESSLKEQRHLKIVDLARVQEIDSKNEIPVGSEEQIKLFLQYHHEKGNFFFFDSEGENTNYIVLEPQFLIDAFKCIITAEKFCRVDPSLRKLWNKLCNEAILEKELLRALWGKDPNTVFLKFEDVLLFFLQKHRILAEALEFEDSSVAIQSRKLGFYIVPSLLRKSDSITICAFLKGKKYTKTSLGYVFEFDTVLATVFSRVTAAVLAKWPLLEFKGNPLIYENVAACKLTFDHAGLLILEKKSLELLVVSLCPPDGVCNLNSDIFRRFVEMVIEQELNKFRRIDSEHQETKKTSKLVRCYDKEHDCKGSLNVHDLDTLQRCRKTKIACPDHASHSLVIQDVIHEWFKPEIAHSDLPIRQLTEKELSKLSRGIGKDWEFLARQLDIPDAEIEHICLDKATTASKIYESLKRWKTRKADKATLDVLVSIIQECRGFITIDDDILKDLIDGI